MFDLAVFFLYMHSVADHPDLQSLLIDRDRVDEQRLAAALLNRVHIDQSTGSVVPMEGFHVLKSRDKVLCLLLARLGAKLLGRSDVVPVSAKDLIEMSGLPSGTVHPALKALRQSRVVSQDEQGHYFVASSQVLAAINGLPKDQT